MGLLIYPAVYGTDPELGRFAVGRDRDFGSPREPRGLFQPKPTPSSPLRGIPESGGVPAKPHPDPPAAPGPPPPPAPSPPRGGPDGRTEGGTDRRREGGTDGQREAAPGPGEGEEEEELQIP